MSIHTSIDQLLILDGVVMGLEDLFLECSNGVFTIGVDLRAFWDTTSDSAGRTHLEDLLLHCFYCYLHYGPGANA